MTWTACSRAVVLVLALAGCAAAPQAIAPQDAPSTGPPADEVVWAPRDRPHGAYLTTAVTEDGDPVDLVAGPDGARFALTFTQDRLRASTAGCAPLEGAYELSGGRMRVGDIAGLEGGCPEGADRAAREAQQHRLADFLAADPAWSYRHDGWSSNDNGSVLLGTRTNWMELSPREAVQPGVEKPVGEFLSTSVTENGAARPLVRDKPLEVSFGDDGSATSYGGCNWSTGPVRFVDGHVRMRLGQSTAVGCMRSDDRWLNDVLEANPTYAYDGTNLVLETATARIELAPRDVVRPDLPLLDGTFWEFESREGRHPADPPAKDWLKSRADLGGLTEGGFTLTGTRISGELDCAKFAGPIELGPGTIRFGDLDVDRSDCRETATERDRWILRLLSGDRLLDVDDRRLTIHDPQTGDRVVLAGDTAAERAERERQLAN